MSNILIGSKILDHIFIVNKKLRSASVEKLTGTKFSHITEYVPWVSSSLDDSDNISKLLSNPPEKILRGNLVVSDAYISDAILFLEKKLIKIPNYEGLLPGDRLDWLPQRINEKNNIDVVNDAVDIIKDSGHVLKKLYYELIDFILPLDSVHRGYSNCSTRGIIYRGIPETWSKFDMAIDIVHELGHQALFVWQSVDSILESPIDEPIYSSVRKDFRPAIQSLHGAVALSFMLHLVKNWKSEELAIEACKRHGKLYVGGSLELALEEAIKTLKENCKFTEIGKHIILDIESVLTQ